MNLYGYNEKFYVKLGNHIMQDYVYKFYHSINKLTCFQRSLKTFNIQV